MLFPASIPCVRLCLLSLSLLLGASLPLRLQADVALGAPIANLSFKDIRAVTRTLDDFGKPRATVLVFTTTGCPLAATPATESSLPR